LSAHQEVLAIRSASTPVRLLLAYASLIASLLISGTAATQAKTVKISRAAHRAAVARHEHVVHRHRIALAMNRVTKLRRRVVRTALAERGVPYVYGGDSRSGFDCSGLVRFVYGRIGISLPHYSGGQWERGISVPRRALQPGDLLFFRGLGHVAIYIGHGLMVHAPHTGTVVQVAPVSSHPDYGGAKRLLTLHKAGGHPL
jgi:cell wall-associated NlpC family hydrolase